MHLCELVGEGGLGGVAVVARLIVFVIIVIVVIIVVINVTQNILLLFLQLLPQLLIPHIKIIDYLL